jgi:hypothetical protein
MSHMLIQMSDYDTVLDEREDRPAEPDGEESRGSPHERPERTVADDLRERTVATAGRPAPAPKPRFRRLAVIVPVKDYRAVSG